MSEFGPSPIPEESEGVVEEHDVIRPLEEVKKEIEREQIITEQEMVAIAEILFPDDPEAVADIKTQLTGRYGEPAPEEALDYLYTLAIELGIEPEQIDQAFMNTPQAS